MVAGILLQRDAGGDLPALLRDLAAALEAAARQDRDAIAATAQARFTARIVLVLPVGAALLAELAQPGLLAGLLAQPGLRLADLLRPAAAGRRAASSRLARNVSGESARLRASHGAATSPARRRLAGRRARGRAPRGPWRLRHRARSSRRLPSWRARRSARAPG